MRKSPVADVLAIGLARGERERSGAPGALQKRVTATTGPSDSVSFTLTHGWIARLAGAEAAPAAQDPVGPAVTLDT